MRTILRFFFDQLYHSCAWSYDLVAATVSLGHWRHWVRASLPFIRGRRVLELAFGTGILQHALLADERRLVAGIDESAQMAQITRRRLRRAGSRPANLARGRAQKLPYASEVFDSAVSTFPNEFIVDPATLSEAHRVLRPGGQLILLPVAWIVGYRLIDRAAAWLFKTTRQTPDLAPEEVARRFRTPLEQAGFTVTYEKIDLGASSLLIIVGTKQAWGPGRRSARP